MLEQLPVARRIVSDGHEVVPTWRIETPHGAWLIFTRFDPDKPSQHHRASQRRQLRPAEKALGQREAADRGASAGQFTQSLRRT